MRDIKSEMLCQRDQKLRSSILGDADKVTKDPKDNRIHANKRKKSSGRSQKVKKRYFRYIRLISPDRYSCDNGAHGLTRDYISERLSRGILFQQFNRAYDSFVQFKKAHGMTDDTAAYHNRLGDLTGYVP